MTLRPVSSEFFRDLRWTPFQDFSFARGAIVAPLVMEELRRAALSLPVGFLKENDSVQPVALLGLEPGENLLVDAAGKWLGRYIPAAFRGHPFRLVPIEGGDRLALCVDEASGLIGPDGPEPFFTPEGELAPKVKQALDFLSKVSASRLATIAACRALDEAGLLAPWTIEVKRGDATRKLEGLLRVDEARVAEASPETLATVRDKGALALLYLSLISRENLPGLGELARRREAEREASRRLFESALAPQETAAADMLVDWNALDPGQTEH